MIKIEWYLQRIFSQLNKNKRTFDLPSILVELWITVLVAWVKRIRSTPYFLLFNVFLALNENHKHVELNNSKNAYDPA